MFNIDNWNWATYTLVALSFVSLITSARKSWESFTVQLIATIFSYMLLYFGGFFRGI